MDRPRKRIGSKDRFSRLPTELIHQILSFVDTRTAIQTSILSNRWKRIWKTLPSLHFNGYDQHFRGSDTRHSRFLVRFFDSRNPNSQIQKLELYVKSGVHPDDVEEYIEYATERNVEDLSLDLCHHYKLSIFSCTSLKRLKLLVRYGSGILESDSFCDLPALTTLHLIRNRHMPNCRLGESCLINLPALTTLCLDGCDLPKSLSLPRLTTLCMARCNLSCTDWNLPALLSLELDDVAFPKCINTFFAGFVKLTRLMLFFRKKNAQDYFISCPQLLSLELNCSTTTTCPLTGNIVVVAPKLRNFSSVGIFSVSCGSSVLENVNIKLKDCFKDYAAFTKEKVEEYYNRFIFMFPGLGSAKILTLDIETIEALSAISNFLECFPSPFDNLRYLKLPHGYEKSSLSITIKSYLLGGSPRATIVTTLPQNIMSRHMVPVPLTSQNVVIEDPLVTPKEEQIDTVKMSGKEEQMSKNSEADANEATQIWDLLQGFGGPTSNSSIAGRCSDGTSSFAQSSVYGVWQGHKVVSEYVVLLDLIMDKYPETFEHFTTKNKMFCTIKLNMLCTLVNAFIRTSITEVDAEVIAEYRALFADLKRSFNINWLVNRLNYIEHVLFSQDELQAIESRIKGARSEVHDLQTRFDEAKCKLRDLHNLRMEKKMVIEKTFRMMGTNLALGYIGDNLLHGP